jgi:phage N-6-adenine-methyltransferase
MAIGPSLFSSRSDEWPTPKSFFDMLDSRFHFTLDPCATSANAKCKVYFTRKEDGLVQPWGHHRVFCNPPYGRTMRDWARKCFQASREGAFVVLLAHARTDTRWFHDWVYGRAKEIRFVRGRLKFGDAYHRLHFPSLVAVFQPPRSTQGQHATMSSKHGFFRRIILTRLCGISRLITNPK